MQLMIDIAAETPAALRLAAQFFVDHATLREAMEGGMLTPSAPANVPTGTPSAPAAPSIPQPPVPSNVLPFPPAPSVPALTMSAPPATIPGMSTAPILPPVGSSVAPASPGVSVAPPAADEFDRSGVPFDVRIHQKSRNQKKDGTWKLQKGIDDSVVAAVMQELAPRMLKAPAVAPPAPSATPAPVGASAPVPLPPPPIPSPPGASIAPPVPPYPGTPQENLSPPSTAIPQAPGDQGKALDPFRTLVAKITAARAEKPPRITAEEVNSIVASAGAPSLQLLNNMPHLLPVVDANIDALLATR